MDPKTAAALRTAQEASDAAQQRLDAELARHSDLQTALANIKRADYPNAKAYAIAKIELTGLVEEATDNIAQLTKDAEAAKATLASAKEAHAAASLAPQRAARDARLVALYEIAKRVEAELREALAPVEQADRAVKDIEAALRAAGREVPREEPLSLARDWPSITHEAKGVFDVASRLLAWHEPDAARRREAEHRDYLQRRANDRQQADLYGWNGREAQERAIAAQRAGRSAMYPGRPAFAGALLVDPAELQRYRDAKKARGE